MYVPANWQHGGVEVRRNYASVALDQFHGALLNSELAEDVVHGLLSVVFWGNASGKYGKVTEGRALARARWISNGKAGPRLKAGHPPEDPAQIVGHLLKARSLLGAGRIADALRQVMEIRHLGMSFASKALAFMSPTTAGVYDKIISNVLKENPDAELAELFVSTNFEVSEAKKREQATVYARWCRWCEVKAGVLNREGFMWSDWDGSDQPWRAIDVERALFALGSNHKASFAEPK